ncbi:hypothetical protein Tcan_02502 [Toxocara canis]|uniref:G_PROTEIN_RECEP_F1_2 domain-containing protein n=1 Tax=Toxocara canis TaxID=6265 RepID=A0A0B2UP00_TOXCA|nr:hypothetical protein Tcan_02502 [Toxocara canis]
MLQLISECPAVPVFIYAALHGPHVVHTEPHLCLWHTNAQYLGICNASLSFFVYIVFSQRFRAMLLSKVHRSLQTLMPCVLRAPPNVAKNTDFNYSQANGVTVVTRLKRTPPTMHQRKKSVSKCSTGDGEVDLVNLVSSRRGSHAGSRIYKFDTLASITNDFDALL